jgi:serine phosphatase RsbU (regulator of sigma subunit)/pSer/pThr/pTyr-binding forkhead associated (FHA) protein
VTVIGKGRHCDIVLPNKYVSQSHARIERRPDGLYIQDLQSTNKTKVGADELGEREVRRLADGDLITIWKYTLAYDECDLPSEGPPTILETIDVLTSTSRPGSGAKPEEKLRVITEIGGQLVGVLELDTVLEKVLDALFQIFPQAERGFIVFHKAQSDDLDTRASKFRHPDSGRSAPSRAVYDRVTREGQAILCENIAADSRFSEIESLKQYHVRTMMCVPVWNHERHAVGILQLDTQDPRGRFTQEDLEFLVALAGTISMAVENARLHELAVLDEQQKQEGRAAREVQRSLIPERPPLLPGYEFWHYYEPAHFVGGDYFDYHPMPITKASSASGPSQRWAIAIGDVSGKGMAAALLMVRIATEVRHLLRAESDPSRVVDRLNRSLCETTTAGKFVTFLLAVVDGETHHVTVLNAGHPAPMIRRAGGRIDRIDDGSAGLPLAIEGDETYRPEMASIGPGDIVVLYTDGVIEAMGPEGQPFGIDGLEQSLAAAPPGVDSVGEAILNAVRRHVSGQDQYDDITLLCFGRS